MHGFIGIALKSTIILAVALLASAALRRRAAAERHLLWCAAIASLAALPALPLFLPSMQVPVPVAAAASVYRFSAAVEAFGTSSPTALRTASPVESVRQGRRQSKSWREWLLWMWVAGTAVAAGRLLAGVLIVARLHRDSREVDEPGWRIAVEIAGRQLGLTRRVRLLESARVSVPMIGGIVYPAIYLPPAARNWDEQRRQIVLLHELAHVKRYDALTGLLARLILCAYWWQPLSWIAVAAFLRDRERASDDLVLANGTRASDYARHLVELAAAFRASIGAATAAVCMARPSALEGRLAAILDPRTRRRGGIGPAYVVLAVVAAVAIVTPLAAMRPQAERPPSPRFRTSPSPSSPEPAGADLSSLIRTAVAQRDEAGLDRLTVELTRRHRYAEAEKIAAAALELRAGRYGTASPEYAEGLIGLGRVQRSKGNWEGAEEIYTRALVLEEAAGAPKPDTIGFLAMAAHFHKDYEKSAALYQRALGLRPDSAERGRLLTSLGWMESESGRDLDAETHYREALQFLDGGSSDAATAIELLARLLGSRSRAEEQHTLEASAAATRAAAVSRLNEAVPSPADAVKPGGDVTAPRLLMKIEPQYSEVARELKHQGTAVLSIVIATDGHASSVNLLRGLGLGLDELAADAIRQWQFQPGMRRGAPVPVLATVEVNFRLW